jgi:hypothetical protein
MYDISNKASDIAQYSQESLECVNEFLFTSLWKEYKEILTIEQQQVMYEKAYNNENSLWNKIIEKIKNLGYAIRDFWDRVKDWFKKQVYVADYNWYMRRYPYLKKAIENTKDNDIISMYSFIVIHPFSVLSKDIVNVDSILIKIYDNTERLLRTYIEKNRTQYGDSLKVSYSEDEKASLQEEITKAWSSLLATLSITIDDKNISSETIRESIFKKYLGDKSFKKENKPIKDMVSTIEEIEYCMNPNKAKDFENLCDIISRGSSKCVLMLKQVDTFHIEETSKASMEAVTVLRTTLNICNTIASSYWRLFIMARENTKKCISEYMYNADS